MRIVASLLVFSFAVAACSDSPSVNESSLVSAATSDQTTLDPVGSDSFLLVYDAGNLPDGTAVVIEGMVVVESDRLVVAQFLTDSFIPSYLAALPIHGVDMDGVATISYPGHTDHWSDHYRFEGVMQGGELEVSEMTYLRRHQDRNAYEDCQAALDHPQEPGGCPEWWLIALQDSTK